MGFFLKCFSIFITVKKTFLRFSVILLRKIYFNLIYINLIKHFDSSSALKYSSFKTFHVTSKTFYLNNKIFNVRFLTEKKN